MITLTPIPKTATSRTILIDGERYRVTYQVKTNGGDWEDQPIAGNITNKQIENRIGNVYARATTYVQTAFKKATSGRSVGLEFNENHQFENLTFSKRNTSAGTKIFKKIWNAREVFENIYYQPKNTERHNACKDLNDLEQAMAESDPNKLKNPKLSPPSFKADKYKAKERVEVEEGVEEDGSYNPDEIDDTATGSIPSDYYIKDCGASIIESNGEQGNVGHCGVLSLIDQMRIKGLSYNGKLVTCDPESSTSKKEAGALTREIRTGVHNMLAGIAAKLERNRPLDETEKDILATFISEHVAPEKSDYSLEDNRKFIVDKLKKYARGILGDGYFDKTSMSTALYIIRKANNKPDLQIAFVRPTIAGNSHLIAEVLPKKQRALTVANTLFLYYPNVEASHDHNAAGDYQHFQSYGNEGMPGYRKALESLITNKDEAAAWDFYDRFAKNQPERSPKYLIGRAIPDLQKRHPKVFEAFCLEAYDRYRAVAGQTHISPNPTEQERINYISSEGPFANPKWLKNNLTRNFMKAVIERINGSSPSSDIIESGTPSSKKKTSRVLDEVEEEDSTIKSEQLDPIIIQSDLRSKHNKNKQKSDKEAIEYLFDRVVGKKIGKVSDNAIKKHLEKLQESNPNAFKALCCKAQDKHNEFIAQSGGNVSETDLSEFNRPFSSKSVKAYDFIKKNHYAFLRKNTNRFLRPRVIEKLNNLSPPTTKLTSPPPSTTTTTTPKPTSTTTTPKSISTTTPAKQRSSLLPTPKKKLKKKKILNKYADLQTNYLKKVKTS